MSEPDFMRRVERDDLDAAKALRLLAELEENGPMKPWTLLSRVKHDDETMDELRTDALKPLTLKGYLTPKAGGDLRIDRRRSFRDDYLLYGGR